MSQLISAGRLQVGWKGGLAQGRVQHALGPGNVGRERLLRSVGPISGSARAHEGATRLSPPSAVVRASLRPGSVRQVLESSM